MRSSRSTLISLSGPRCGDAHRAHAQQSRLGSSPISLTLSVFSSAIQLATLPRGRVAQARRRCAPHTLSNQGQRTPSQDGGACAYTHARLHHSSLVTATRLKFGHGGSSREPSTLLPSSVLHTRHVARSPGAARLNPPQPEPPSAYQTDNVATAGRRKLLQSATWRQRVLRTNKMKGATQREVRPVTIKCPVTWPSLSRPSRAWPFEALARRPATHILCSQAPPTRAHRTAVAAALSAATVGRTRLWLVPGAKNAGV